MNFQDQHEKAVAIPVRSLFPITILSSLILMLLTSCDTEPKDWENAKNTGTVESYDVFLGRHPDGEFSETARAARLKLLRQKTWEEAAGTGTIEAYMKVLEDEVEDDYAEKAHSEITLIEDWQSAREQNTIRAYETFLSKHAETRHGSEARAVLKTLREKRDWSLARGVGDIDTYQWFVNAWPQSPHVEEAKTEVDRLEEERDWSAVLAEDTLSAYRDFLGDRPDSRFSDAANKRMRELLFLQAAQSGDIAAARGLLVKGVGMEVKDKNDWTALHHATAAKQVELVQWLLENGAQRDPKTKDGQTPAILAMKAGGPAIGKLVQILALGSPITDGERWTTVTLREKRMEAGPPRYTRVHPGDVFWTEITEESHINVRVVQDGKDGVKASFLDAHGEDLQVSGAFDQLAGTAEYLLSRTRHRPSQVVVDGFPPIPFSLNEVQAP